MKASNLLFILFLIFSPLFMGSAAMAKNVMHQGYSLDTDAEGICLDCHGDDNESEKTFCAAESSHPVFTDYPPQGKEEDFQPLARVIEKGISLPSGQIRCISCHNLENQSSKYRLAVENTRSKLCLACHIK